MQFSVELPVFEMRVFCSLVDLTSHPFAGMVKGRDNNSGRGELGWSGNLCISNLQRSARIVKRKESCVGSP